MNVGGGPRILCTGIIVLDEVFRVEEFPQADGKVEAKDFFVVNGGCAANAAVAILGEVALDLTLNNDGTVQAVKVIEGNPLLTNAAADAVKQRKYQPLPSNGNPMNMTVVVLTFEKNGHVH